MKAPARLDAQQFQRSGMKATHCLNIFVNGERVFHVLSYDVDRGQVTRLATDEHGNILIAGGKAVSEILHGRIAVELKELQRA